MVMSAFGVNLPMIEILLVFVVLLTAGLIFILLELKKLNEYLVVERTDLQRLERDLGALEIEEQKIQTEERDLGVTASRVRPSPRPSPAQATRPSTSGSTPPPARPTPTSTSSSIPPQQPRV